MCRVFDVGSFEDTPYIVMERLEGVDLAKVLRQAVRVSLPEACDYLIQACAGVAEAHAAKIVHRDLKPGNLFVTERADGTPLIKILDFGIAKAPHDDNLELTGTFTVLGSPAYMSLEQLRSSKLADARSDIWSLGVILFELVAGRKPFVGENVADLALKIALDSVPRLPDGPAALDAIIARCLAHDPGQRYQSVGELARALAPFADEPARRLAASIGRAARGASPVAAGVAPVASWSALPTETSTPAVMSVAFSAPAPPDARPTVPLKVPLKVPVKVLVPPSLTPGGHDRCPVEPGTRARPPSPPLPPSPLPPPPLPPSATIGAHESMLPTTRWPSLGEHEPSLGEIVKPPLATTMQTAGAIENASPARVPHLRVGAIVTVVGGIVGIWLGVVAAGEDENESAASPATQLIEPPDAAPPPPPAPTFAPPAIVPDAAVAAPEEDPAIEMEPAALEPPVEPPVEPPSASKPKPKPRPRATKPNAKDLGKSRI